MYPECFAYALGWVLRYSAVDVLERFSSRQPYIWHRMWITDCWVVELRYRGGPREAMCVMRGMSWFSSRVWCVTVPLTEGPGSTAGSPCLAYWCSLTHSSHIHTHVGLHIPRLLEMAAPLSLIVGTIELLLFLMWVKCIWQLKWFYFYSTMDVRLHACSQIGILYARAEMVVQIIDLLTENEATIDILLHYLSKTRQK